MNDPLQIGPFGLLEQLGKGGMGTVFRARHRRTGVDVAVKVIGRSVDADLRGMFHREVQAHARLLHPGIVYLFEYGEISDEAVGNDHLVEGSPFIAMELADRGTLRDLMPTTGWPSVREILRQMIDGLAFAHARGIVHRDLKPENLLAFDDGDGGTQFKLADFGIAHALGGEDDRNTTSLSGVSGTPFYMAPEQARARWRDYGPWTDLYSVGCIAWELVSGRPPFKGDSTFSVVLDHERARRPAIDPQFPVPDDLQDWVHRAMAVDPESRFRRAADARRALDSLDDTSGAVSSPEERAASRPDGVDHRAPTLALLDDPAAAPTTPLAEASTDIETDKSFGSRQTDPLFGGEDSTTREESPDRALVPETWRIDATDELPSQLVDTGLGLFGLREPPFVDRDSERDHLWEALRGVASLDRPRVVIIVGAAGAGKSRLVEWMARRAHELGAVRVMRATHTPGGDGPGEGMSGMVRRAARAQKLDRGELYDFLCEELPELGEREIDGETDARALCELLEPTDDEADDIDGPRYRFSSPSQKVALVARFVRRYATRRRPFVWLDDAQWGDLAPRFIDHLLEGTSKLPPTLAAVTLRADILADHPSLERHVDQWREHDNCTRLDLPTLAADDHREFVERTLPLEEKFADRIAQRTEGNPLFATELLRHLVEEEKLEAGPDGFVLGEGTSVELPDDVHEIWLRRLDDLFDALESEESQALWRAVETAAALGREVDANEWGAVCNRLGLDAPDVVSDRLLERGLADPTDAGWAFTHGLLVESLERRARADDRWSIHHRRCAELLEALYPERPGQTAARRANHWIQAGALEKAIDPLLEETERFEETGDPEGMDETLERARALFERLELPDDDPRRIEYDIQRAYCDYMLGHGPGPAREEVDDARERAERVGRPRAVVRAFRLACQLEVSRGNYEEGASCAERAFERAKEAGADDLLAGVRRRWGWTERNRGNIDAAEKHFREAAGLALEHGQSHIEMAARMGLGWTATTRGEKERAKSLFEEVLEQHRREGSPGVAMYCLNGLGELARFRGDPREARRHYRTYRKRARELNRPIGVAVAHLNLAQVELMAGRLPVARDHLERAETSLEELSQREGRERLIGLSHLTLAAGSEKWSKFDEFLVDFDEEWPEETRLIRDHPWLLEMAGDYAEDAGNPERAREAWRLSRNLWDQLDAEQATARLDEKLERV